MSAIDQITSLLDSECTNCSKMDELKRTHGSVFSKIDGYCNQVCPIGKELQGLGKQLGKRARVCTTPERQRRREMAIAD